MAVTLNPTELLKKLTYAELIKVLDERFYSYKINGIKEGFDVCAVLCGATERGLQGTRYLIRKNEFMQEAIESDDGQVKLLYSFMENHRENLSYDFSKGNPVEEIVNAFQRMVDKGMTFDSSINNIVEAYFINRGVDRPYITQKLR